MRMCTCNCCGNPVEGESVFAEVPALELWPDDEADGSWEDALGHIDFCAYCVALHIYPQIVDYLREKMAANPDYPAFKTLVLPAKTEQP